MPEPPARAAGTARNPGLRFSGAGGRGQRRGYVGRSGAAVDRARYQLPPITGDSVEGVIRGRGKTNSARSPRRRAARN